MRDYRADRKDHWFVVTPAPTKGDITLDGRRLRPVPANVWHIYDTKAGPEWGTLAYVHAASFRCTLCSKDITQTQAGLSRLRRNGAAIACKDCVTSELTTKDDRIKPVTMRVRPVTGGFY